MAGTPRVHANSSVSKCNQDNHSASVRAGLGAAVPCSVSVMSRLLSNAIPDYLPDEARSSLQGVLTLE